MYLDLCGSLKKTDDVYVGKFNPAMYETDIKQGEIPLFIIIEAMTQAVCRACSKEFFEEMPAFPAKISDLFIEEEASNKFTFENSKLFLKVRISKKADMGVGKCDLMEEDGKVLVSGSIWVAQRIMKN